MLSKEQKDEECDPSRRASCNEDAKESKLETKK